MDRKKFRACCGFISSALFLAYLFIPFSFAQEEAGTRPAWWDAPEVQVQMERKVNSVKQYFDIYDNLLTLAYKARGAEAELLLKKSIKAYAQLLEWFKEKRDMPVAAQAQYQIAAAYQRLGDIPMAKQAYRDCLSYRRHINDPPQHRGDTEILTVLQHAEKKLKSLP